MSQQNALALSLNTPPEKYECSTDGNDTSLPLNNGTTSMNAASMVLPFSSQSSQYTPSMFNSQPNALEPPPWHPPCEEEIEYADALNNAYDNQHHYLQPVSQDDSTIGSNKTNTSFTNAINFNAPNALRPRGLSLCSYSDAPSVGSGSQPQQGHAQHRRHPSLPVSFFSTTAQQGSHPMFPTQEESSLTRHQTCKQCTNALQSTTKSTPYEVHSHRNASQVQADGAMAGLDGIMLDLYMVDRSIDSSTANMLATKVKKGVVSNDRENGEKDGIVTKKRGENASSQKSRKTSLGTLNDIQCILELHKVDRIVDRFKQDLQMPEFVEEEAWQSGVLKDLRKIDVEMEEYTRSKKARENKKTAGFGEVLGRGEKVVQYQFDLSDDDEEGGWRNRQNLGGEGIFLSTGSHLTDLDAYQFLDPHETEVLKANAYQASQVSASINDNLHEVIHLLRTDVEVDGASRYHSEMNMIRPLLETDQLMNKWKERSELRDMWNADLKAMYATDLEVDGAKRKYSARPQKVGVDKKPAHPENGAISARIRQPDTLPPVDSIEKCTDREVKDMLSQHIPQVPNQFCPTSPELMPMKSITHAADFTLPPPAVPMSSPQGRRAIFSSQEKASATMAAPKAAATKRSIFSRQEKSTAVSKCAFQRGVMMPGTTTVVMANGGEMIDDIPVGKVLMR